MRWVPSDMLREGIMPSMIDVLLDVELEPEQRHLPGRALCGVPLERAYDAAEERGLIETKRLSPVFVSLSDPYALTDAGKAVLERYRAAILAMGQKKG